MNSAAVIHHLAGLRSLRDTIPNFPITIVAFASRLGTTLAGCQGAAGCRLQARDEIRVAQRPTGALAAAHRLQRRVVELLGQETRPVFSRNAERANLSEPVAVPGQMCP